MEILISDFGEELLRVHIKECRQTLTELSLSNFAYWKENIGNSNYNFYFDLVFKLLLGFKCYRSGVRQNNSNYMLVGRQAVAPNMFNGKHMICQNLLPRDLAVRTKAPNEIKSLLKTTSPLQCLIMFTDQQKVILRVSNSKSSKGEFTEEFKNAKTSSAF
ncbi:unnamed protein product [Mytilus edulis]|uniref:Uncharacterized protein n=1 Tax=Mytilus edulis TaxID=6550 RepID=A0A8S3RY47_MYTED|nr:unnamed protein product [Mytilus edulis]